MLYFLQIKRYLNVHFQSLPFEICSSLIETILETETTNEL